MSEEESLSVLTECIPIYYRVHDEPKYCLSKEDIKWLDRLKIIWDHPSDFKDSLIHQAGMDLFQFAFLGGSIMQIHLKRVRAELLNLAV